MAYIIDLAGQVAVITGGSKGIGAAIAEVLAKAGAQVVIDDILNINDAKQTLESIEKVGPKPLYLQYDISSKKKAFQMANDVVNSFGKIDILINNAGVVANWDTSWNVHVKGAYYCAEAVKPHMTQEGGRIINIISASIFTGGTGIPEYVASKGGVYALTLYLARHYAPLGILVNGIAPAVIKSDMLMTRYKDEQELNEHYIPQIPIRRIGYPIDVARVALFLASELSSFICGEIIIVDGGRMKVG